MKILEILVVTASTLSAIHALALAPRTTKSKVVGLDLERRSVRAGSIPHRTRKRSGTVTESLFNDETLYFAKITLGTPAQTLQLHLDTGSSDLWVNTANSTFCLKATDECEGGTFDPDSSSTLKIVNGDFNITYVDGSNAAGDYATDVLGFGGATLSGFQFGIGDSSTSTEGVLGIGYETDEAQVQRAHGASYPNLPTALVNAGLIERKAYSLWLNDVDAQEGTILFGGVNSAKYSGELATLPILPEDGEYIEFLIALTGIDYNGTSVSSQNLPAAIVLDSGSTLTYLPEDIAQSIFDQVGAQYDSNQGFAVAPCDIAQESAYLGFTFSGVNIKVNFSELLLSTGSDSGESRLSTGQPACIFGVAPISSTVAVLGDTFLRSAYVVYDLDNNQISLAQTVFNTTANDVKEIASGTALVPGATAVASPVTSVAAGATGSRALGSMSTSTSFSTNSAPPVRAVSFGAVGAGVASVLSILLLA